MPFEWDPAKNASNITKHGVSFAVAVRIFDSFVLTRPDRRMGYGENRLISIGRIDQLAFLVIVHTDREGATRLISARPANRTERKNYDEALRESSQSGRTGQRRRQ